MKRFATKTAIAAGVLGLASAAQAAPITVEWQDSGGCSSDANFYFDYQYLPDQGVYTLDGKAVTQSSGFTYPARGAAAFNPVTGNIQVSILYTSATGETFAYGASLNTSTLSGSGTRQRIAHGSVGSDCDGTLSVVP